MSANNMTPMTYNYHSNNQHSFINQIPYQIQTVADQGLDRVNKRLDQLRMFLDEMTSFCSIITKSLDNVEYEMEMAYSTKKLKTSASQPQNPNGYNAYNNFQNTYYNNTVSQQKQVSQEPTFAAKSNAFESQPENGFIIYNGEFSTEYPSDSPDDEVDVSKAFENYQKNRPNEDQNNFFSSLASSQNYGIQRQGMDMQEKPSETKTTTTKKYNRKQQTTTTTAGPKKSKVNAKYEQKQKQKEAQLC